MTRDECRASGCDNEPGEQTDRSDYNSRLFCSVRCQTKHEHIRADARDAQRDERERHTDDRHPGVKGEFL